jgi:hypothetical protein
MTLMLRLRLTETRAFIDDHCYCITLAEMMTALENHIICMVIGKENF